MDLDAAPPQPGHIVRVRSRQYLVEQTATPERPGDAHLVRLDCLDDDAQGQPLEVLWEHEPDAERYSARFSSRVPRGKRRRP